MDTGEEQPEREEESQKTVLRLQSPGLDSAASDRKPKSVADSRPVSVFSCVKEVWREAARHHRRLRLLCL